MSLRLAFGLFLCGLIAGCMIGQARADDVVINCVFNAQHTGTVCETTPIVSTAQEPSRYIKNGAGNLIAIDVANWSQTTNLTLMLFDAPLTATPQGGTVAACSPSPNASCLIKWFSVPTANSTAPGTFSRLWYSGPMLHFLNGLYVACSTTGPTTLTLSNSCTFSAEVE